MRKPFFRFLMSFGLIFLFVGDTYAQLQKPILECVNRVQGSNGNVLLTWQKQPASGGSCSASFEGFHIFSATDKAGPYTEIAVVTDVFETTYVDNSPNSSAAVLYYFMQEKCSGFFSESSDTLDTNPPIAPQIISVTVTPDVSSTSNDQSEPTQLSWNNSPSPEAAGLIIYRANVNGAFESIDTIFDIEQGFYIDSTAMPDFRPMAYKVAAIDACNEVPGPDNGKPHQTIKLSTSPTDCAKNIELNWTRYLGWDEGGVREYEITDGTQSLGVVDGNTTSFVYTLPEDESVACLRIVGTRNSNGIDNTNSNEICIDINEKNSLEFLCLKNVTIKDGVVDLLWSMDSINQATEIQIYRDVNDSTNLDFLGVAATTDFEGQMNYIDQDVATERDTYFYQVVHLDECDRELRTVVGSPILLKGLSQFDLTNQLSWSPFVLTDAAIQNYIIYRKDGEAGTFEPIATVDTDVLEFVDVDLSPANGVACYYVEAQFLANCNGETEAMVSRSNEICILQASRIFLPNAFAPNSPSEQNRVFKPLILYPNAQDYSMVVLNRWGEQVFETSSIDDAWDGFVGGKVAAQGVYLYMIQMRTETGFLIERKGSVLLVR